MTLLILGGTGETRVAADICNRLGIDAIASLAGATRSPRPLPVPTRIGGFGGTDGFSQYLNEFGISAILDTTHPFASRITDRSYRVAQILGIPILRFDRPAWVPGPDDNWINIKSEDCAALHVAAGATVFLATGRQTLHRFANLSHAHLICRQIDPPEDPFPFPNGQYMIGRPPFSERDETNLFRKHNVQYLIVKNAGGAASRTKLDAAANLNIPVLMIERPPSCGVISVQTMAEVEDWLSRVFQC
ncbi:MAG: cobalt-precorrin-6A reductase [Planktomarina sp.]